jgi:hypothetical protein
MKFNTHLKSYGQIAQSGVQKTSPVLLTTLTPPYNASLASCGREFSIVSIGSCGANRVTPDCSCADGYTGPQCQTPICFGKNSTEISVCTGRGSCVAPNICVNCQTGYIGDSCQFPICFGKNSTDPLVCNQWGNCTTPNQCTGCCCGYTSANCDTSICFGISGNSSIVCSSQGICSFPDTCVCSNGFIWGDRCQFNEFHWANRSGNWSTISNWLINSNGGLISAQRIPSYGDTIFVDQPGNYTINLDLPIFLSHLSIGGNFAFPTIIASKTNVSVNGTFIFKENSTIVSS